MAAAAKPHPPAAATTGDVLAFPSRAGALSEAAREYARQSRADRTLTEYEGDWRAWLAFLNGKPPADATPADFANWLAAMASAGRKPATLRRRAAGVRAIYRARDLPPPDGAVVRAVMHGTRRAARHQARQARPLTADLLAAVLDALPLTGNAAARDRALLAVGWQAALRRSEIAALSWRDFRPFGTGAILTIRESKARTEPVDLPLVAAKDARYCPLAALDAWRAVCAQPNPQARIAPPTPDSPIFRRVYQTGVIGREAISPATVGDVLRRRLIAADIPPAGFSAHSLRAGMLTSAALAGTASTWRLMDHSRHRRSDTLDNYVRDARRLSDHPAAGLL